MLKIVFVLFSCHSKCNNSVSILAKNKNWMKVKKLKIVFHFFLHRNFIPKRNSVLFVVRQKGHFHWMCVDNRCTSIKWKIPILIRPTEQTTRLKHKKKLVRVFFSALYIYLFYSLKIIYWLMSAFEYLLCTRLFGQ